MKKTLSNTKNFTYIIVMVISCIVLQHSIVMAESNVAPVTTSYDDMVKAINQTQTNVEGANVNETPAHAAVTGSLTSDEIAVINSQSSVDASSVQKSIDSYVKSKPQNSTKQSIFKLMLKFLIAMLWVCISSVVIFIVLISYKSLVLKRKRVTPTYESKAHSLDTPVNFKEAIKLFLDKTKWS